MKKTILTVLLVTAACGVNAGGQDCTDSVDCPNGQICNLDTMTCELAAQCQTHADCDGGTFCNAGVCEQAAVGTPCASDDNCRAGTCNADTMLCGCSGATFQATLKPADLLLVVDRSGSMAYTFPNNQPQLVPEPNKWSLAKDAVNTLTAGFPEVRFGLMTYPALPDPDPNVAGNCSVGAPGVAIGENTANSITTELNNSHPAPNSLTPIVGVMNQVANGNYFTNPDRSKTVVMITDGAESCEQGGDPATLAGAAAATLKGLDVTTYAIGYSNGADPTVLNAIASNGGTGQYLDAADGQALLAAFSDIAGTVASCTYDLDTPGNVTGVVVLVNGVNVQQDATNGYTFEPSTGILTFNGSACDDLKATQGAAVTIATSCTAQPD